MKNKKLNVSNVAGFQLYGCIYPLLFKVDCIVAPAFITINIPDNDE